MTDQPQTTCPRCRETVGARVLHRHLPKCFTPRTLERMLECLGADTSVAGCWRVTVPGNNGLATSRPKFQGKRVTRWVVHLRDGAPLSGLAVIGRHTCDNEWCVRPDHIVPGTQGDNLRDAIERGQQRYGGERSAKLRAYWARRRET